MKRKFLNLAILLAISSATLIDANAQTRRRNTAAPAAASGLMASLPESDAVAHVKVKQLLNEAMPRILAGNPAKIAEVNASIDRFKERTGLDPRMFNDIALGIRFTYPADGVTKFQTVGLANGSFSSAAMVSAGTLASNGKYRAEKHHDKTIYIFTLEESIKLFGVLDFKINELAASPLDNNILALGDLEAVRAAIDAGRSRKRANAELISLASKNPNAVIGFGSNMSEQLISNFDFGNAPIGEDLKTLRHVYGSVTTTERDLDLFIGARAVNAQAAKNLGDQLDTFRQLGSFFVGRLSGARGVLAKSALTNLKIVSDANELQIRTSVAQAEVGPLFGR